MPIILGRKGGGGGGPAGGVTSIAESGQAALTGAVTLSEGANVALTQVGQDIEIAATAVPLAQTFISRTAGDLTITDDNSWHDVPTIGDLSISAVAGDVLLITVNGVVSHSCQFEVQLPNGPNYVGPGVVGTQGIAGLAQRISGAGNFGGAVYYTVQAADISAGNVALRMRYITNSSGATTIFASTAIGPLVFGVVNLG